MKKIVTKSGEVLIFLSGVLLLLFIGEACDHVPIPDDGTNSWDTDGDGISNAVENNTANDSLNLNDTLWNDNPSYALGDPCNNDPNPGSLQGGLNMVDQGTGYWHYNPENDTDDWGTLALINMIEGAGRNWSNRYFSPRIGA